MPHSAVTTSQAPATGLRLRLADLIALASRFPLSVHQLLFRLAIAGVFLRAGLTKISSWESTVALFADEYKVPVLAPVTATAFAATVEVGCSTLLVLGLGTRLAALPLIGIVPHPVLWTVVNTRTGVILGDTQIVGFPLKIDPGGATALDHQVRSPRGAHAALHGAAARA